MRDLYARHAGVCRAFVTDQPPTKPHRGRRCAWRGVVSLYRPVQRHNTPPSASSTSVRFGWGLICNKCAADTSMPGVQIPHCAAPCAKKLCCNFSITVDSRNPSTLVTDCPSTCPSATRQLQTGRSAVVWSRWGRLTGNQSPVLKGCVSQLLSKNYSRVF